MENAESKGLKPKTVVLIIAVVLMLISLLIPETAFSNKGLAQLINLGFAIAFNLLTVFWCSYDSAERGEKLSSGFVLATVIFGILALIYYLFKSRGFRSGLIAFGKLILIFLGMIIFTTIIQIITESM